MAMILLNFAHPLTENQLAAISDLTGQAVKRVITAEAKFSQTQSFTEQARALVDAVGLMAAEWQTLPLLVNLPSFNVIAALVLAELHGQIGYFPAVVRMRAIANATPPQFEVAEIINSQVVRDAARQTDDRMSCAGSIKK